MAEKGPSKIHKYVLKIWMKTIYISLLLKFYMSAEYYISAWHSSAQESGERALWTIILTNKSPNPLDFKASNDH